MATAIAIATAKIASQASAILSAFAIGMRRLTNADPTKTAATMQ